jgi:hypothetical protein
MILSLIIFVNYRDMLMLSREDEVRLKDLMSHSSVPHYLYYKEDEGQGAAYLNKMGAAIREQIQKLDLIDEKKKNVSIKKIIIFCDCIPSVMIIVALR